MRPRWYLKTTPTRTCASSRKCKTSQERLVCSSNLCPVHQTSFSILRTLSLLKAKIQKTSKSERNTQQSPRTSTYGDIGWWDLFWFGHCGCRFPRASDINAPLGYAVILNDITVPEPQHVAIEFGNDELITEYPAHTRVVSRARVNTCTPGYALSLPGARRLLCDLSVHKMTGTTDMMFRSVCDGVDGRPIRTCLAVQLQLFQQHRPVGSKSTFSDISDHGSDYNHREFTKNVRWGVRLNFPKLVDDKIDCIDLFKDGECSDIGFN